MVSKITKINIRAIGVISVFALCLGGGQLAAEDTLKDTPIYPSWSIMSQTEKTQFLAGYILGFRNAKSLGEVALEYVRTNPKTAASGLTRLLGYYKLTEIPPTQLVPLLDRYFQDIDNRSYSLRTAISKLRLQ